jgi:thiol-disulfide isomerase/thioredoxin
MAGGSKAAASRRARTQPGSARQRLAASNAAGQRQAQVRRRLLLAGGSVAIVLVFVAALVVVKLNQSSPPVTAQAAQTDAPVAAEVASVPPATFNAVGAGTAGRLSPLSGVAELTADGKPEVLYMGGEFCPFCAAERWALAAALSRFGTLSGASFIHSSPTDGDIPTLTFYKSSYTSKYLTFTPVEWFGEADDPSTPFGHVYLQQPTAQEAALFARYANGSIPFLDIANRYLLPQTQYSPEDLSGLTWAQIAAAMQDPSSHVATDIDGAANTLTAAMCTLTHGQPGNVCTSAGVKAAAASQ